MTNKRQFTYVIGDRVAERPKLRGLLAVRNEAKERVQKHTTQRYGYVVDIIEKPNKLKRKQKFLIIQWDHLASPTEHASMRICPEKELARLTKEFIVPGE
jgi:hypothetical protein